MPHAGSTVERPIFSEVNFVSGPIKVEPLSSKLVRASGVEQEYGRFVEILMRKRGADGQFDD